MSDDFIELNGIRVSNAQWSQSLKGPKKVRP